MPKTYATPKGKTLYVARCLEAGQFVMFSLRGELFCLKEEKCSQQVVKELEVIKELCDHPNVIAFYESWVDRHRLCILTEYYSNSLDKLITQFTTTKKRFTNSNIVSYMQELSSALKFFDYLGIVYGSLEPSNILIDRKGTLKLGLPTNKHTRLYMSPERWTALKNLPSDDVWALGCILFELMALRSPWIDSSMTLGEMIKVMKPNYESLDEHYTECLIDITKWMLCVAAKRPAIGDVHDLFTTTLTTSNVQPSILHILPTMTEEYFTCPITYDLPTNPVLAQDGHVYEKEAIERWFSTSQRSPVTNKIISNVVTPVFAVRKLVADIVKQRETDEKCKKQAEIKAKIKAWIAEEETRKAEEEARKEQRKAEARKKRERDERPHPKDDKRQKTDRLEELIASAPHSTLSITKFSIPDDAHFENYTDLLKQNPHWNQSRLKPAINYRKGVLHCLMLDEKLEPFIHEGIVGFGNKKDSPIITALLKGKGPIDLYIKPVGREEFFYKGKVTIDGYETLDRPLAWMEKVQEKTHERNYLVKLMFQ